MKIQESAENYLEAILVLKKEKGRIRSIDIARHLEFTKPSISRAINLLKNNGYVTVDKEGWIELTEEGQTIAGKVYERHSFIAAWLTSIGVPADIAAWRERGNGKKRRVPHRARHQRRDLSEGQGIRHPGAAFE